MEREIHNFQSAPIIVSDENGELHDFDTLREAEDFCDDEPDKEAPPEDVDKSTGN